MPARVFHPRQLASGVSFDTPYGYCNMKSTPSHLLGIAAAIALCAPAAVAQTKHILFYGNSFTVGGDIPHLFGQVAAAAGQTAPNIEDAAASGTSLAYQLTTASQTAVISDPVDFAETAGFQWDHVILQEYSTLPTSISAGPFAHGDVPRFRNDARALFKLVQAHSPSVAPVMYETWARHPGNWTFYRDSYSSTGNYPQAAAFMQKELRDNYALVREDLSALVAPGVDSLLAPVGDAFEQGCWDGFYGGDLYHQNNHGALTAALVIYQTIYQDSPTNIPYSTMNSYLTLSDYGVSNQAAWDELTSLADSVVPEPSSAVVLLAGLFALMLRRFRPSAHRGDPVA